MELDLHPPVIHLPLCGQFTVDQEIGSFQVGALLSQLLDRVPAVLKDTGLTVDARDGAAAGGGVGEAGVVDEQAEVVLVHLDIAEIHCAHRAIFNRHFVQTAGPVIGHRKGVFGHRAPRI